jgi:hypothetical protein
MIIMIIMTMPITAIHPICANATATATATATTIHSRSATPPLFIVQGMHSPTG